MTAGTPYWNGKPCEATRGSAIRGKPLWAFWWCAGRVGKRIKCLKVKFEGKTFFLADEDGSASYKIFSIQGGPWSGSYKSMPVDDPETFREEVDEKGT